jgi:hypothetical protein
MREDAIATVEPGRCHESGLVHFSSGTQTHSGMLEAAILKGFVDCDGLRLLLAQNRECGLSKRSRRR